MIARAFGIALGVIFAGSALAEPLPDAVIATGDKDIKRAWLAEPTDRYRHAILGDAIEAGALVAELTDGRRLTLRLAETSVFEDREVRLADLDGNGTDEMVVVESHHRRGAALAVYGVSGDKIALVARDSWIGTPNRWLNPAGIADFDGDGRLEIAVVVTPHIGGTLKLLRPGAGQQMTEVASQWGFSNHAIGSRDQGLSAVVDWNGDGVPDLLLPDDARDTVVVVTMKGGEVRELDRFALDAPVDGNFTVDASQEPVSVQVPLMDGTITKLGPR